MPFLVALTCFSECDKHRDWKQVGQRKGLFSVTILWSHSTTQGTGDGGLRQAPRRSASHGLAPRFTLSYVSFSSFLKKTDLFYVLESFACMFIHMCTIGKPDAAEGRRGHQIPWEGSYRWSQDTMCDLGIKPGSSV